MRDIEPSPDSICIACLYYLYAIGFPKDIAWLPALRFTALPLSCNVFARKTRRLAVAAAARRREAMRGSENEDEIID